MTSGIINVNKPPGWTSFQVVGFVRRHSMVRRVGHAGTLDPAATGVLIVCLGQAVRVTEYLMDLPKTYRGVLRLGATTTTYDAEGEVVEQRDPSGVTEEAVRSALSTFEGEIEQTPPAYSAVKVRGRPAHRLARGGQAVALKPRPARIYRAALLRFVPPDAEIEVECARGTYIRTLAHDLGQVLGCGAHLAALERTRVGPFRFEDAATIEELQTAFQSGAWETLVLPMDCGLTDLPAVTLHFEDEKDLRHGQPFALDEERVPPGILADGLECRAYAEDGSLAGIIRYDSETGLWRPHKVFAAARDS